MKNGSPVSGLSWNVTRPTLRKRASTKRSSEEPGYNGVLVGLALATFLAPGPLLWVYVALGGAVSTIAILGDLRLLGPLRRGAAVRRGRRRWAARLRRVG